VSDFISVITINSPIQNEVVVSTTCDLDAIRHNRLFKLKLVTVANWAW